MSVVGDDTASAVRRTGQIKFYDSRKGFGFIKCDDGTRDVCIKSSHLPRDASPTSDQRCSFITIEGKKGPFAKDLKLL